MLDKMDKQPINVAIVEDDENWINRLSEYLEELGFTVSIVAITLEEALDDLVPQLIPLGVSYVFVDGDLGTDFDDGENVATSIKALDAGIKIVGFSGDQKNQASYVDISLGKSIDLQNKLRQIFLPHDSSPQTD